MLINNLSVEYPINYYLEFRINQYISKNIRTKNYNILNLGLIDKILDCYIINNKKLNNELGEFESKCFLVFLNSVYDEYKLELMIIKLCYKFLIYEFSNGEIIKYNKNLEILNRYI